MRWLLFFVNIVHVGWLACVSLSFPWSDSRRLVSCLKGEVILLMCLFIIVYVCFSVCDSFGICFQCSYVVYPSCAYKTV